MKMMKKLLLTLLFLILIVPFTSAETLTFQWNQPEFITGSGNLNYLKEWKLYWSDSSSGPYDTQPVATIPYDPNVSGPFTTTETPSVAGSPATTVTKYFVIVACGDVPKQDGTTEYQCSGDSNEVVHEFWIPAESFSVPIDFKIIVTP